MSQKALKPDVDGALAEMEEAHGAAENHRRQGAYSGMAGLMAHATATGLRVVVAPSVHTGRDKLCTAHWLVPSLEKAHWPEFLRGAVL